MRSTYTAVEQKKVVQSRAEYINVEESRADIRVILDPSSMFLYSHFFSLFSFVLISSLLFSFFHDQSLAFYQLILSLFCNFLYSFYVSHSSPSPLPNTHNLKSYNIAIINYHYSSSRKNDDNKKYNYYQFNP